MQRSCTPNPSESTKDWCLKTRTETERVPSRCRKQCCLFYPSRFSILLATASLTTKLKIHRLSTPYLGVKPQQRAQPQLVAAPEHATRSSDTFHIQPYEPLKWKSTSIIKATTSQQPTGKNSEWTMSHRSIISERNWLPAMCAARILHRASREQPKNLIWRSAGHGGLSPH